MAKRAEWQGREEREERKLVCRVVANYSVHTSTLLLSCLPLQYRHVQAHTYTHTCVYTTPCPPTHSILSMCPLPSVLWQPWASSVFTKMSSHFILPACACKCPISSLLKALLRFYGAVRARYWLTTKSQVPQSSRTYMPYIYTYTEYPHCLYKMQYTRWVVLEWLHGSIRVKRNEGGHDR